MREQQHTPGPWRIKEEIGAHGELCFLSISQVFPEGDYSYRGHVCTVSEAEHINGVTAAERDANARLIAAAPEMLEALTRIAGMSMSQFASALDMASEAALIAATAVNKATGSRS